MTNKKTSVIFIVSFIIPLLLAYGVLKLEWIPTNTVNHGAFLKQEIKLAKWPELAPKAWSIAVLSKAECDFECLAHRKELENLHLALGKNQNKVDLVLLGKESPEIDGFKNFNYSGNALKSDALYLIDHMGLVVLTYPVVADAEINRVTNKGLMKDLKKLLNYARSS